jgi:hypothetical protein
MPPTSAASGGGSQRAPPTCGACGAVGHKRNGACPYKEFNPIALELAKKVRSNLQVHIPTVVQGDLGQDLVVPKGHTWSGSYYHCCGFKVLIAAAEMLTDPGLVTEPILPLVLAKVAEELQLPASTNPCRHVQAHFLGQETLCNVWGRLLLELPHFEGALFVFSRHSATGDVINVQVSGLTRQTTKLILVEALPLKQHYVLLMPGNEACDQVATQISAIIQVAAPGDPLGNLPKVKVVYSVKSGFRVKHARVADSPGSGAAPATQDDSDDDSQHSGRVPPSVTPSSDNEDDTGDQEGYALGRSASRPRARAPTNSTETLWNPAEAPWEVLDDFTVDCIMAPLSARRHLPAGAQLANALHFLFQQFYELFRERAEHPRSTAADHLAWERCTKLFLIFPALFLRATEGNDDAAIRHKMQLFVSNDASVWQELLHAALSPDSPRVENPTEFSMRQYKKRKATRHICHGQLSKAMDLLTSEEPSILVDDHRLEELQNLLPQVEDTLEEPLGDAHQLLSAKVEALTVEDLRRALDSLPSNAAVGSGSYSVELLSSLVTQGAGNQVLGFIRCVILQQLPRVYQPYLIGGNVNLLAKKSGGVRNITPQSTFAKVADKLLYPSKEALWQFFSPHQFGVGAPGGSELVVHLVDAWARDHPDHFAVSLDIKNAFGTVRRADVQRALRNSPFAYLEPWFVACYGVINQLSVSCPDGVKYVQMCTGVIQGSVLSSLYFSLPLQEILVAAAAASEHRHMVVAIMDDITVVGPREVEVTIQNISARLREDMGVALAPAKCKGLAFSDPDPPPFSLSPDQEIEVQSMADPSLPKGYILLGIPFGTPAYIAQQVDLHTDAIIASLDALDQLEWNQGALLLIRYSIQHKVSFLMRCLAPAFLQAAMVRIQVALFKKIGSFLPPGIPKPERRHFARFLLPTKKGGLGLQDFVHTMPAAYVASWAHFSRTIRDLPGDIPGLLVRLQEKKGLPDLEAAIATLRELTPSSSRAKLPEAISDLPKLNGKELQAKLLEPIHKQASSEFFTRHCPTDAAKAHYRSASSPQAVQFLTAIPTDQKLTFNNSDFGFVLALFFDIPFGIDESQPCCITGGRTCNLSEHHAQTCRRTGWRISRHTRILEELMVLFRSLGIRFFYEPRCEDGESQRGPDLRVDNMPGMPATADTTRVYFDATCTHVQNHDIRKVAAQTAQAAASKQEASKLKKYAGLLKRQKAILLTLAFESGGAMGSEFQRFWNMIRVASQGRDDLRFSHSWITPNFYRYWMYRVSIVYWRETAVGIRTFLETRGAAPAVPDGIPGAPRAPLARNTSKTKKNRGGNSSQGQKMAKGSATSTVPLVKPQAKAPSKPLAISTSQAKPTSAVVALAGAAGEDLEMTGTVDRHRSSGGTGARSPTPAGSDSGSSTGSPAKSTPVSQVSTAVASTPAVQPQPKENSGPGQGAPVPPGGPDGAPPLITQPIVPAQASPTPGQPTPGVMGYSQPGCHPPPGYGQPSSGYGYAPQGYMPPQSGFGGPLQGPGFNSGPSLQGMWGMGGWPLGFNHFYAPIWGPVGYMPNCLVPLAPPWAFIQTLEQALASLRAWATLSYGPQGTSVLPQVSCSSPTP